MVTRALVVFDSPAASCAALTALPRSRRVCANSRRPAREALTLTAENRFTRPTAASSRCATA